VTADTITALAALVAAVGVIITSVLALWAKHAAERSRQVVENSAAELTVIKGVVMELGPALDGRLSQLLKAEIAKARSEGLLDGAQAQRDREGRP
jgi:predicted dinucleotide-utilizing enzyme